MSARDAERDLQSIANALAHDWKGPLNTVSLYAGVLEMKHPEDDEIETIVRATGTLLSRFRSLSEYLRLAEPGRGLTTLAELAAEDRERLTPHEVSGWDTAVSMDRAALARLVLALVDNAEQHGRPPVRVRVEHDGGMDCVVVCDSGEGIPAALGDRAADLLVSGTPTKNAGVGLALARKIVTGRSGRLRLVKTDEGFTAEAQWPREAP